MMATEFEKEAAVHGYCGDCARLPWVCGDHAQGVTTTRAFLQDGRLSASLSYTGICIICGSNNSQNFNAQSSNFIIVVLKKYLFSKP